MSDVALLKMFRSLTTTLTRAGVSAIEDNRRRLHHHCVHHRLHYHTPSSRWGITSIADTLALVNIVVSERNILRSATSLILASVPRLIKRKICILGKYRAQGKKGRKRRKDDLQREILKQGSQDEEEE